MQPDALKITIKGSEIQCDLRSSLRELKEGGIITRKNIDAYQKLILTLRGIFDTIIAPHIEHHIGAIIEDMRLSLNKILPGVSVDCLIEKTIHDLCVPKIAIPESIMDIDCQEIRKDMRFDPSELPAGRFLMYPRAFINNKMRRNSAQNERRAFGYFGKLMRAVQMMELAQSRRNIEAQFAFKNIRETTNCLDTVVSKLENIIRDQKIILPDNPVNDLESWMRTPIEIVVEKTRGHISKKVILMGLMAGALWAGIEIGKNLQSLLSDKPSVQTPEKTQDIDK